MKSIELIGFKATVLELVEGDKRDTAIELLDYFFKKARTLEELDAIGELSLKTEHRDLYLECAEAAYGAALTPTSRYAARSNLIKAYNTMNYPEKALHYVNLQLEIDPNDFDMLCQKASNLSLMGDKISAEVIVDDLIRKYPDKEKTLKSMLSGRLLRQGKLVEGVESFIECYKPTHKLFETQLGMKRWKGSVTPGATVYVNGEGGIGDEIINIRFFNHIKEMGMNPVLCSPDTNYYRDKNTLFRRHGVEILTESVCLDSRNDWVPMMSLPIALNLREEDLWKGPYLTPLRDPKNKLSGDKFKIGIKCSGNPFFGQDEYRKIPLELMLSYLPKDADIYYIDKKKVNQPGVIDLGDKISSWEDTLDFIDQMDCIVSSCTSLVHAAGAIGKTTFVAVPIAEYYIWTSSRTDNSCPWYGSNFFVMRQKKPREWDEPLAIISERVHFLMQSKSEE